MGVEAALIGSAAIGAGSQLFGSQSAGRAQQRAAQIAAQTQLQMYNQTRQDLTPFRDIGVYAGGELTNRLMDLTAPIVMDQGALERTPGYRFNLNAGLRAAQSSAAARGLGLSGAAIKAATGYATGLADNTYQNQFNNENINRTNTFNRLLQTTQLGQSAAAQTGSAGTAAASGAAQAQIAGGQGQAAAAMAGANAISNAANNIGQYYAFAPIYNRLTGLYGGSGGGAPAMIGS